MICTILYVLKKWTKAIITSIPMVAKACIGAGVIFLIAFGIFALSNYLFGNPDTLLALLLGVLLGIVLIASFIGYIKDSIKEAQHYCEKE